MANPNLDLRGELEWVVFDFTYSAAISLRDLFTFFVLGIPIIRVNCLLSRDFVAVSCADEIILLLFNIQFL